MNILFRDSHDTNTTRLIARIVAQDSLPADLPRAVKEGGDSARFNGTPGQLFEGFYEADGAVVRLALAGAGKADAADRSAALEKAGAALSAKYLTSGETALALDAAASKLSAEETASVLLGARLRGWRWDEYRTKLRDEQKKSLAEIVVVCAPSGTDMAWADAEAVAKGVEHTHDLEFEP